MKEKTKEKKMVKFSELENKVAALWMKAATGQQEENNYMLKEQEYICNEFAANHGIIIKKQYRGTNERAKTEELYRKMIFEVAADRDINILLISSFDRLSRDGNEAAMMIDYLRSKGVYVISATQPTDFDNPLLGLLFNNVCNIRSYEKDN